MQTLERARPARRALDKPQFVGFVTDLIVSDAQARPRPQAFLVEQSAHWTLPTHFHLRHQFQLVVGGSGSIGRNPLEPLSVHYASPHSGYGPIVSGGEGLAYLTLRVMSDVGAWYLPESREQLQLRISKQQAHGAPRTQVTAQALQTLAAPAEETLIAPDAGGLAAWLLRLPPHAKRQAPAGQAQDGGRFYVVTQGALRVGEETLDGLATVFVPQGELLDIEACDTGLELIVLQFPAEAALAA